MSLFTERLKYINVGYVAMKHIVSGYIRSNQCLNELHIPDSIASIILLFYFNPIESTILTDNECDMLLLLFVDQKKLQMFNSNYKLLYRASRDGYTVDEFFDKCDKKNNIFCIIQSSENNVFGGFTSLGWDRLLKDSATYTTDNKAFIYLIRSTQKFKPQLFPVQNDGENAIGQFSGCYLGFGYNGFAFYLYTNSNSTTNSGATERRCDTYNIDQYTLNGHKTLFNAKEIEVFQV
eukprot:33818_1